DSRVIFRMKSLSTKTQQRKDPKRQTARMSVAPTLPNRIVLRFVHHFIRFPETGKEPGLAPVDFRVGYLRRQRSAILFSANARRTRHQRQSFAEQLSGLPFPSAQPSAAA